MDKKKEIFEIEKKSYEILSRNKGRVSNNEKNKSLKVKLETFKEIPKRLVIKSFSNKPTKHNLPKEEWLNDLTTEKNNFKIAVYTAIFGNYDSIQEPEYFSDNIDYFIFSHSNPKSVHWNYILIPNHLAGKDDLFLNRYLKLHPSELFKEYDYVIYVDGNVKIISDVSGSINRVHNDYGIALHYHARRECAYKEAKVLRLFKKGNAKKIISQMKKYKQKGFPNNFGLLEATIIISNPKSKVANQIFQKWWEEFINSESMRDQLSLPYVLWSLGVPIKMIGTLGTNLYRNPKYQVINHK